MLSGILRKRLCKAKVDYLWKYQYKWILYTTAKSTTKDNKRKTMNFKIRLPHNNANAGPIRTQESYDGNDSEPESDIKGEQIKDKIENNDKSEIKRFNSYNNDDKVTSKEIFQTLYRHVWPHNKETKRITMIAMGLMIGSKLTNISVPFFFKNIVDNMANIDINAATIPITMILAYGISRSLSSVMREGQSAIFASVTLQGTKGLAQSVFKHLHSLDLDFHISKETGLLSKAIDRGVRGIGLVCNTMLLNVAPTIIEFGLVMGILGYKLGPAYALCSLGTIGAYMVFTIVITQRRTVLRQRMNALDNKGSAHIIDSLINYETVKYFNNEDKEVDKYGEIMNEYKKAAIKVQTSLSFLNAGQNIIFTCGLTGMMLLACNGIITNGMTIGDLVLVNSLLFQLSIPLNFIGSVYREVKLATTDLETMIKLTKRQSIVQDKPNAISLNRNNIQGKLTFNNVTFSYLDSQRDILNNCSFTIEPNTKVALVGFSGSGKSTILRLLYRFYNVNSGEIIIDNNNIKDITCNSLRQCIGVVPQDIVLFNDTLYNNIAYGNLSATYDDIIRVTKEASLHNFIESLPDGYNTIVGERGLKLSGGEKQRVAISRMLLKNCKIIILDEPTSALDLNTEMDILNTINNTIKNKTIIIIAHRLSTIQNCDKIFVFDNGKIVEQGNHSHLIDINKRYKALWDLQQNQSL